MTMVLLQTGQRLGRIAGIEQLSPLLGEPQRCGALRRGAGVIFASNELSSASGGVVGAVAASFELRGSLMLACFAGSFTSFGTGAGVARMSCSRILLSGGSGLRGVSTGGAGVGTGGGWVTRALGAGALFGGIGAR